MRVSRVLFFFPLPGEEGGHLGRQKRTLCLPQEAPGTRWNFDLPRDRSNLHVFLPRGKRYCLRTIAEAAIVQGFDETSPTLMPLRPPFAAPCRSERNFLRIHVVRGKRDLSLAASFVTDSPLSDVRKGFSLRKPTNQTFLRILTLFLVIMLR